MRFINHAVNHVEKIFPEIYANRSKKGSYHFCLAYERNKLIAVGVNVPERTDARALRLAKRLNLQDKVQYPYLHAEESLIARLISLNKLANSLNIVVLRLNKFGKFGQSKPCPSCQTVLKAYGLSKIYWSDSDGKIIEGLNNEVEVCGQSLRI